MSEPSEIWADHVVSAVREALSPLADAARAPAMRAYMKDVAPYLGIATPTRRAALRPVWSAVGSAPSADALGAAAEALWVLEEREYVYSAIDLLGRNGRVIGAPFLVDVVEPLIVTKSWWDSVDGLHSAVVGPLVSRYPTLVEVVQRWASGDERWLIRSAIIHQLGYRENTDVELLFSLCRQHAHQTEFFIAKAIGWALRDFSYIDSLAVERFVVETPLQPLSKREALKAINRHRSRI